MTQILSKSGIHAASLLIDLDCVLIPIKPRSKHPLCSAWPSDQSSWITRQEQLVSYLAQSPDGGCSLLHQPSRTAALDLDHPMAHPALGALGIDLNHLLKVPGLKIRTSRGLKPLYRVPEGIELKRRVLNWPPQEPGGKPLVLLELRSGPCHDLVPPSIHPVTGLEYVLEGEFKIPPLPEVLLALWQNWDSLKSIMEVACPWHVSKSNQSAVINSNPNIFEDYNASHSVDSILAEHGYVGPSDGPWLFPGSQSGNPGVRLLPETTKQMVWSHHAGDPLMGYVWDAAGLELMLKHGINTHTAQKSEIAQGVRLLSGEVPMTTVSARGNDSWPPVSPLPPAAQRIPALTPDYLPLGLRDWLVAEARGAGLPLEMMAVPVIFSAGAIIGTSLALRNSVNAPAIPANLYALICNAPGTRKTYALDVGVMPLRQLQASVREKFEGEKPDLMATRDQAQAHLDNLLDSLKGNKSQMTGASHEDIAAAHKALKLAEDSLVMKTFLTNDTTIEALGLLLQHNSRGIAVVRDELTGWLSSFERLGREQDRAFYLEAANGTNPYEINRVGRGATYIPRLCLSVIGNIQPLLLTKLVTSQLDAGDGLLQRFQLFIAPDEIPAFNQEALRQPLPTMWRTAGLKKITALARLEPQNHSDAEDIASTSVLTYSPDAQKIYDTWETQNASETRNVVYGDAYRSHVAKQPGTFARLALIFHALEVVELANKHPHPDLVGSESARLAQRWCDYLLQHARKLWGEGGQQDIQDAHHLLSLIERGRVRDNQKQADLSRLLRESNSSIRGERLDRALAVLERCNHLRITKQPSGKSGGRPSALIRLNPSLLD